MTFGDTSVLPVAGFTEPGPGKKLEPSKTKTSKDETVRGPPE